MDNLPNEIVLQILGYLNLGELIQCARVSKRFNSICKDNSLSYSQVPNKQVGPNKRVGWIFYVNFIKKGAK